MGVVYLAEDIKLRRKVAIKFLPHHITANENVRKRFELEAQAAASLNHPNIATIHAIEEAENEVFIVMEYIDGMELKVILDENKNSLLSIKETITYSMQIAEALDAAHRQGIIHRDIKAGNIMISKDGNVKIMDFGLAKIGGDNQLTQVGFTIGTVAFMSPEQTRGEQVDHRADIWSFGIILYEMLTGHLPFKGDYDQAIIYSILNEEPIPVREYSENCSSTLVRIVNKCLEKNPEDRYQTARELLQDIEMYDADPDYGFTTKPVKLSSVVKKNNLFGKAAFVAGLFALIVVLSFILPSLWSEIQKMFGLAEIKEEKHLLILPFTNIGGETDNQAFCDGIMETLSSKLTQLEQFHGSLWVVPSSEVFKGEIQSVDEARQRYGINLAVTGSLQFLNSLLRLNLNLVDAENLRQLNSSTIDIQSEDISSLQNRAVIELLEMLHIELEPGAEEIINAGATNVPEAFSYYLQGRGYLQRYENTENIMEAERLFSDAIRHDSMYALAYAGLSEAYWRNYEALKDPVYVELARSNCLKAFNIDSLLAPVNVTLGLIYSGIGDYGKSIDHFNRALINDPTNASAYRGLAKAYEATNNLNEAEQTFKRAIKLKQDYWAGYNDLGVFYYRHGRYDEAIEQFKEVIRLTPDNYRGYNNLGGIYYLLERWSDALSMFEKSLENKESYNTYSNLGTLNYIEGKYNEAAAMYEQALKINDKDYLTWANLAAAYNLIPGKDTASIRNYQKAILLGEERLKVNPNNAHVMSNLSAYYADIGNELKSMELLTLSLKLAPDDVEIIYRAATTYEILGNRDDALLWIKTAIENGYSRSEIENQPELKNLVNDERYKKLFVRDDN
jgi:serine/threonine-protein kinase